MKINRQKVYDKCNGHCAYCGINIAIKDMQVDHYLSQYNFKTHIKNNWKVPEHLNHLTEDDVNHFDNLLPSCRSCNNYKSTFNIELFRSELEAQSKRIRANNPMVRLCERYGIITVSDKPIVFYFETVNQPS